jgi:hypothetical protein
MTINAAQAVRMLAELLEIDRATRMRRTPPSLPQKQRRAALARDLARWALAKQRGAAPPGAELRQHPRANVRVKVQLSSGPRPIDLSSDSLGVGGVSVLMSFAPRVGDMFRLRIVPLEDAPIEVTGEVVWFEPVRSRAGLRFHDLSEEGQEGLERLVFSDLLRSG